MMKLQTPMLQAAAMATIWPVSVKSSGLFFFFFNDTATTEIYTLSYTTLFRSVRRPAAAARHRARPGARAETADSRRARSEEHTSELQSPCNLVCRLLLEKKKNQTLEDSTIHTRTR